MTRTEIDEVVAEPIKVPGFWPTELLDEYVVANMIKNCINFRMSDGCKVDIYSGDSVFAYMAELQTVSGSSAELMGRMRRGLEAARGEAIRSCMTDETIDFKKLSATLQSRFVDSKIAMMLAAYEYAEYLSKRLSYAMDACRSMLSYIKTDMQNNRPIPQQ